MSEKPLDAVVPVLARELGLAAARVRAVLELEAGGATVPFIARYRKERTQGLDEVAIRAVLEGRDRLVQIEERRGVIRDQLEEMGLLDEEMRRRLESCCSRQELEDLYLPHRPRRRSKATEAIERGLEALAERILAQPLRADPTAEAARFVDPARGVADVSAALEGAGDIVVERIACDADLRRDLRDILTRHGEIHAKKTEAAGEGRGPFDDYADHQEALRGIPSHRFLALKRGEAEGILDLRVLLDRERTIDYIARRRGVEPRSPYAEFLLAAVKEAWSARIKRSLEGEVLSEIKIRADHEAARVFADNLEHLLLAPPFGNRPVVGIDPGFRSGCKCAAIDGTGRYLGQVTIHPHQGETSRREAEAALRRFLDQHPAEAIAVGNGTAGRETEAFVRAALKDTPRADLAVVSVSESGASVYSASEIAREEFPDLDLTIRGAVSIARRLQDPLAELVKVDPRSIGVGQYQHDVDPALLEKRLGDVVESCVNRVGVELNTASASLLGRVAGLGAALARRVVEHRETKGAFRDRRALLEVKGLGPRTFEQAAGFLRVQGSPEPLDRSAVHPERYALVRRMARDLGAEVDSLVGSDELAARIDVGRYVDDEIGEPTLRDIVAELTRPGRDPRRSFSAPAFRDDVTCIDDLVVGMELEGVVTNVTAFGAFVDIGVHQDGLVHRSAFWRRVREPAEIVHLGDRLRVIVQDVDRERGRIGLRAEPH